MACESLTYPRLVSSLWGFASWSGTLHSRARRAHVHEPGGMPRVTRARGSTSCQRPTELGIGEYPPPGKPPVWGRVGSARARVAVVSPRALQRYWARRV